MTQSNDNLDSFIEVINHILIKHPQLANTIEVISQRVQGKIHQAALAEWELRLFSPPSPHFIKQLTLLRYCIPNGIWVETGTYLGDTTNFLSEHAQFVYSIEPEPELFENAHKKFSSYSNVKILFGLSENILPTILPNLSGNINFWLDGHFSEGFTHKGPQDTPILDELKSISENINRFDNICVLIDDIRCFSSNDPQYSSYPSLNQLSNWALANNLTWHIEHDIFIAKNA